MLQKHPALKRALSLTLCFSLILSSGVIFDGGVSKASAAETSSTVSLNYIEKLKSWQGGAYNILEIAPQANTSLTISEGSIGYYIAGQEPCKNFAEDAEKYALQQKAANNTKSMQALRKDYVSTVFSNLKKADLCGDINGKADANPLTLTANYDEKYPWEYDSLSSTDKATYSKSATLSTPDIVTMLDRFKSVGTGLGSYDITSKFTLAQSGQTATYVQVIDRFTNIQSQIDELHAAGNAIYYYNPTFTTLKMEEMSSSTVSDDTPLYINLKDRDSTLTSNSYVYAGTKGSITLDESSTYYIVTDTGAPESASAHDASAYPYAAVSTSFRPIKTGETGFFVPENGILEYTYVGSGNGSYSYDASQSSSVNCNVKTSTVYYMGGFRNNNWFLRYVFDCADSNNDGTLDNPPQISLNVTSVTPDKVSTTTNALDDSIKNISTYDMVALTNGVRQIGGDPTAYSTDLSIEVKNLIINAETGANGIAQKAIFVDSSLASCPQQNLKALEVNVADYVSSPTQYVKGSVYLFTKHALLKGFPTASFAKVISKQSSKYTAVIDFINKEATERAATSQPAMSDSVKMLTLAHVFRHVICAAEPSSVKTEINVLDIEPAQAYKDYSSISNKTDIGSTMIKAWTGQTVSVKNVVTMSTSEFIGKIADIDDLTNNYDLIYIGSGINGFETTPWELNSSKNIVKYYDTDMTGLVYTNIGDKVVSGGASGFNLSGLLDRDYSNSSNSTYSIDNIDGYHKLATGYSTLPAIEDVKDWIDQWFTKWLGASGTKTLNDTTRTFRYPGNDLTPQAVQKLEAYASVGHPIVVAADLKSGYDLSGTASKGRAAFSVLGINLHHDYSSSLSLNDSTLSVNNSQDSFIEIKELLDIRNIFDPDSHNWGSIGGYSSEWTIIPKNGTLSNVTASSLDMTAYNDGTTFSCSVSVPKVNLFGSLETTSDSIAAQTRTVTLYKNSVNQNKVDNCSNMYTLLSDTCDTTKYPTVFDAGTVSNNADLYTYINISKPTLKFADTNGTPTAYTEEGGLTVNVRSLDYTFTIVDTVNPNSTYTAHLYVDTNADGRFSAGEELDSVSDTVYKTTDSKPVSADMLAADVEYTLKRPLPDDIVGIVPWKLVIVQNGNAAIRSSETGFTHATGTAQTINVLQIQSSRDMGGAVDLSTDTDYQKLFKEIKSDFDIHVYTVTTDKLGTASCLTDLINNNADFKALWETKRGSDYSDEAAWQSSDAKEAANIDKFLNSFDMLILGFDDAYTGMSWQSSEAVARYIDTGKAVLFTHDCTSFFSLPAVDYQTENYTYPTRWYDFDDIFNMVTKWPLYAYSNKKLLKTDDFSWYCGYTFNMVLRSKVGLDRYGISDATYGRTKMSNPSLENSGIVASNDYLSLLNGSNTSTVTGLTNSGYSIAYKPKSGKSQTVAETQGYTTPLLIRYIKSGVLPYGYYTPGSTSDGFIVKLLKDFINDLKGDVLKQNRVAYTTKVTQVNKGQITTYPFDVNTSSFNGTKINTDYMTIAKTHMQYDQLNMNGNDIVVWYCLAGGGEDNGWFRELAFPDNGNVYDYMTNDVRSQYYIYSRGNVTYSGAGHDKNQTLEEKKLFVNTIAAAFRVGQSKPVINYTDEYGNKTGITSVYVPADNGVLESSSSVSDASRRIYFKIQNTSLGTAGSTTPTYTATISCKGSNGTVVSLSVYSQDTAQQTTSVTPGTTSVTPGTTSVTPGKVYYLKLDDIVNVLGDSVDGATITITPTKTFPNSSKLKPVTGDAQTVTLRTQDLFDLG